MQLSGSVRIPVITAAVLAGGLVAGSLVRINPFSESGAALTALDISIGTGLLLLFGSVLHRRKLGDFVRFVGRHPAWRFSALFLLIALFTLLVRAGSYPPNELIVAGAYLLRLIATFVLFWLLAYGGTRFRKPLLGAFGVAAAALVSLGFLQLQLVPNFRFARREGWDPHLDRLFSTFLDPNFFGIFAVLAMAVALAMYLRNRKEKGRKGAVAAGYLLLFLASWVALYFTFSRSAWVAGLIAIPPIAWKYRKMLTVVIAAVFIAALFLPTRLGDRFESTQGLIRASDYQGERYVCDPAEPVAACDPSGSNRIFSIRDGLELARQHPVFGVGYNAYAFAMKQDGKATERSLRRHSANGSDSSLLNVLVTTGAFGLLAFLAFFAGTLWRLFKQSAGTGTVAWLSWGLLWFTPAWLAASFFNNAVLYQLILVPWGMLLAVALARGNPASPTKNPARGGR
ncbi:MAG: O-antigen ligase family protein [bacterium]|nr:O-antigen ligase family protein [bacterium]MDZ4248435.1 O-antigen ligase family protein [Patescibacteria group bacterium]